MLGNRLFASGFCTGQHWTERPCASHCHSTLDFPAHLVVFFFESQKAVLQHNRVTHGHRSDVKMWAGADCRCIVCGSTFSTRLRLIAHLTENRVRRGRPPCRASLQCIPPLAPDVVCALDLLDTKHRRDARHNGHTQPLTTAPAKNVAQSSTICPQLLTSPPPRGGDLSLNRLARPSHLPGRG